VRKGKEDAENAGKRIWEGAIRTCKKRGNQSSGKHPVSKSPARFGKEGVAGSEGKRKGSREVGITRPVGARANR